MDSAHKYSNARILLLLLLLVNCSILNSVLNVETARKCRHGLTYSQVSTKVHVPHAHAHMHGRLNSARTIEALTNRNPPRPMADAGCDAFVFPCDCSREERTRVPNVAARMMTFECKFNVEFAKRASAGHSGCGPLKISHLIQSGTS